VGNPCKKFASAGEQNSSLGSESESIVPNAGATRGGPSAACSCTGTSGVDSCYTDSLPEPSLPSLMWPTIPTGRCGS
jgi:hypothetical protein